MENEVRNQCCPSPDGDGAKPACCCCGGKGKPIVAAVIVALIVIAAVAACFFAFGGSCPALPKYAPEGTDVIAYANLEKISGTKVGQAFRKTLAYEKAAKKAQQDGIDIAKTEKGEVCLFFDLSGETPKFVAIGRVDAVAEKMFDLAAKKSKAAIEREKKYVKADDQNAKAPKFSDDKIAGKKAVVAHSSTGYGMSLILMDKNTLQFSVGGKDQLVTAPLKAKAGELAKAVDAKALVSVVYKFELPDFAKEALKSEESKMFRDVATDLNTVTLNLYEAGDDLELKLVAVYDSAEAAAKAEKTLTALRALGQMAVKDDKELAGILNGIDIAVNGKQISAGFKYSQSKLVEFIAEWDKGEREAAAEKAAPQAAPKPAEAPEKK